MTEFNLSELTKKVGGKYSDCEYEDCKICLKCYRENDIKEFIRLLKKELKQFPFLTPDGFIMKRNIIIDKLAGNKLV